MSNKNNGVLSGITSGLSNTYSYLASQYPNGLTLEKLTEAKNKNTNINALNQSFASYLENNFSTIDNDGDGVVYDRNEGGEHSGVEAKDNGGNEND